MKKIIIANWKMNPATAREALALARKMEIGTAKIKKSDVVLAAPFPFLSLIARHSSLKIGAQDVFWEPKGAFTGEVSASQLRSAGVGFVIVGHSERRRMGENNAMAHKKLKAVLKAGMRPILCVGEEERKREVPFPLTVRDELHSAFTGIPKALAKKVIVVYEPVWAISTSKAGKADNPRDVFEMSLMIRRELFRLLGKRIAAQIPILYGGSVDEKNAAQFVHEGRVDGLLVGGASLHAEKFLKIVKSVATL